MVLGLVVSPAKLPLVSHAGWFSAARARCSGAFWFLLSLHQVAMLHRTLIDTELLGNRLDAHALGA